MKYTLKWVGLDGLVQKEFYHTWLEAELQMQGLLDLHIPFTLKCKKEA